MMRLYLLLITLLPCTPLNALEFTVHQKKCSDSLSKSLNAEEIDFKQYRTADQLLKRIPGVNVINEGGLVRVSIRGAKTGQTLVLMNGIPLNDPADPSNSFNFADLETEDIEEIKVYTGGEALEFGSSAIGGVIAIKTKKGYGSPKAKARLEHGSSKSTNLSTSLQGSEDCIDYYLNLTGKRMGRGSRYNPLHVNDVSNFHKDYNADASLGLNANETWQADLFTHLDQQRFHVNGFSNTGLPEEVGNFGSKKTNILALKNQLCFLNRRWFHIVDASHMDQDRDFTMNKQRWHHDGQRLYSKYETRYQMYDNFTLVGSTGWQQDIAKAIGLNKSLDSSHLKLKGEYLIKDQHLFTLNGRIDKTDKIASHKTAQSTLSLQLIPSMLLKTSFGTGFRAPAIQDIYGLAPFQKANLALKPEESKNFDVGIENEFLNGDIKTSLTYFLTRIRHIIVWDPSLLKVINRDHRKSQGIESKIVTTIFAHWTLGLSYTLTHAKDYMPKQPVIRQPKHKILMNACWQATQDLSFFTDVLFESKTTDKTFLKQVILPTTTDLRIGGQYQLNATFTLLARLENVLNQKREKIYGFGRPRRGCFFGIKGVW